MTRAKQSAVAEMRAAAMKKAEEEIIDQQLAAEVVIKVEKLIKMEQDKVAESQDAGAQEADMEQREDTESQNTEAQEADMEQDEVAESQDAEDKGGCIEQDEVAESQDAEVQEANADGHVSADGEGGERNKKPHLIEEDHAFIAEVLKMKVKLSDGTESEMFSYGPPKSDSCLNHTTRRIICHLCRITIWHWPNVIQTHINGRRHLDNLKWKINAQKFFEPYLLFHKVEDHKFKQFKIFPGENIPEVTAEYESRIVEEIDWELKPIDDEETVKSLSADSLYEYNKSRPLLGLDYLLKMKHNHTVKVYCALCDFFAQPNVYQHLTDAKHQATYIIKHFPTLYEKVVANLKITDDIEKETALRNIFRKLYRKIEMEHGFKQMHLVYPEDFFSSRLRYINKVKKMPHYDENTMEFTEAVVDMLISKSNKNLPINKPDPPTLRAYGLKRSAPVVCVEDAPVVKYSRYNDETELWTKYRSIMSKKLAKLAAQYKKYEQDPPQHPQYQDEWREFWHKRCVQLKRGNIDPDTYNFDKEWLPFWGKRLKKLYHKDVTDRRAALREKFGFPIGRRTPSPSSRSINDRHPNQIRPIHISGNFVPSVRNFVSNDSSNVGRGDDGWRQQQQQQHQSRNRQGSATNRVAREPVSIISVLRLLTALEDQLGSLGPKAVQLLGKAVLCEKNNQNMDDLLMDNDYYVLFASCKEKLKGQIMMNVIDNSKILAINTVIEDLSTILGMAKNLNRSIARSNTGFGNNTISDAGNFGRGDRENVRKTDYGNFGHNNGRKNRANDTVHNRGSNDDGNYRTASSEGRNYYRRSNNDGRINRDDNNDGDNYRGPNKYSSKYRRSNVGSYHNNDGDNTVQYRASNADNFNTKSSSFDGGNSSNQRSSWMDSVGSIYSSLNKSNTSARAFGRSNRPQPLMSFRNASSNYGSGSFSTRRFN